MADDISHISNGSANVENNLIKPAPKFQSFLNFDFGIPDKPRRCTWTKDADPATSPHSKAEWRKNVKIFPNICCAVGNTPIVKLNKIPKSLGLKCDVFVKCEYFNPGGSIKDRIGFRMIEDAESCGLLKPGSTIIEPTSGNTGIGLALGAAVKGYRCIIVMSEKMSNEKVCVLKALGAEIIRTPITAESRSPNGLFGVAHRLRREIPNSIIFDQYSNPGNPLAHYDTTAEEILYQCDGKVDMIVLGAGTGGTITGIGRKFKELSPNTIIVAVDPEGSVLAEPESLNKTNVDFYEVEGIGYDFLPTSLDRSVVDRWIKVTDRESLPMARKLIKEEGLLCGGSSGAALAATIKAAANLPEGKRVIVILPDSIRNYLTKFISDEWMEARGLKETLNTNNHWWWDIGVASLQFKTLATATPSMTCDRVLHCMKKQGIDQMPIIDKNGGAIAMVTLQNLLNALIKGNVQSNDLIDKASIGVFPKLSKTAKLGLVSRILEKESYVLLTDKQEIGGETVDKPMGIVTAIDLLQFISNKDKASSSNST